MCDPETDNNAKDVYSYGKALSVISGSQMFPCPAHDKAILPVPAVSMELDLKCLPYASLKWDLVETTLVFWATYCQLDW